jgi:hypothetical protein
LFVYPLIALLIARLANEGILFLGFYRQEGKMFKAGTVAELESLEFKGKIPEEVYQEALRVVSYLDETFGKDSRDRF